MAVSLRGGDGIAGDRSSGGVVMMSPELVESIEESSVMGVLAAGRYVAVCGLAGGRKSGRECLVTSAHVAIVSDADQEPQRDKRHTWRGSDAEDRLHDSQDRCEAGLDVLILRPQLFSFANDRLEALVSLSGLEFLDAPLQRLNLVFRALSNGAL